MMKALAKALDWVVRIDPPAIVTSENQKVSLLHRQAIGLKWIRFFHVKWELLLLVYGLNLGNQFLRETGVRGGVGVTRELIKNVSQNKPLSSFKKSCSNIFESK